MTTVQAQEWQITTSSRVDVRPSLPSCAFRTAGDVSYTAQLLKYTPAAKLLPGAPGQEGIEGLTNPTQTEVDGFGAVEARLTRGSPADCAITVDTGDTSSMQFIYKTLDVDAASPADLQTGCNEARRFAQLGLENLAPG
ncbi:hypothetical protein EV383_5032 [Pseudonocardia sediminis]|uniref:DUF3558 domain-containing protein n=1 Tax=Pseudonocardia sediminis TaxID=1397368 RepID=A0A4Q7V1B1_PSEST|nr:hypothetical protein [Pseudonocardia sediminis]RZT88096.1 hypothetical protein EV383_5032 [Pseudonocardia sediminis]